MIKLNVLFNNLITDIEKNMKSNINADTLAKKYNFSSVHLQRLFKFAFKQTLAGYIRSRKLSASLEELYKTNLTILDIALQYGYEHEQSYIRAFKREFDVKNLDIQDGWLKFYRRFSFRI